MIIYKIVLYLAWFIPMINRHDCMVSGMGWHSFWSFWARCSPQTEAQPRTLPLGDKYSFSILFCKDLITFLSQRCHLEDGVWMSHLFWGLYLFLHSIEKLLKEMKPPMRIWQCVDGHAICAGCRQGFTITMKITITMTFTCKLHTCVILQFQI